MTEPSTLLGSSPPILGTRYRVREAIGEGGMGIVYAGDHQELGTKVAIKVQKPALAEDGNARARFLREARLAASVEGEHSTRIYDVATDDTNRPYLVMEFLAGETLAARLSRVNKLGVADSATILIQLLDALAEAHAKGVVHRDLKPANLFLVDRPGEPIWVKVMDFGISKPVGLELEAREREKGGGSLTEPKTLLGSPEYMSPEQLRAPDRIDQRTDLWACGVILFEILAGGLPFEARTLPDLYAQIVGSEPRSLVAARPDVPGPIVRLVERCLRKAPEERPRNAFDVATALAPFASDGARALLPRIRAWCNAASSDGTTLEAPGAGPRPAPSSLRRALVGIGTVAASGALAFGIASVRTPSSTPPRPGAAAASPAGEQGGPRGPGPRPSAEPLVPPSAGVVAAPSPSNPPSAQPTLSPPPRPSAAPSARAGRPGKPRNDLEGIDLLP